MISTRSGTTFVATLPSGANGPIEQLEEWYGDLMVFTKAEVWCYSHKIDRWKIYLDHSAPLDAYCAYNANRLYKKPGFGDDQGKQG